MRLQTLRLDVPGRDRGGGSLLKREVRNTGKAERASLLYAFLRLLLRFFYLGRKSNAVPRGTWGCTNDRNDKNILLRCSNMMLPIFVFILLGNPIIGKSKCQILFRSLFNSICSLHAHDPIVQFLFFHIIRRQWVYFLYDFIFILSNPQKIPLSKPSLINTPHS